MSDEKDDLVSQRRKARSRGVKKEELEPVNIHAWIERLKASAAARVDVLADTNRDEVEERRQVIDRRKARLGAAGECDPEMAQVVIESIGRCPRVEGHAGSVACAKAVESFIGSQARTLLLLGPTGRGKSAAATWAIVESKALSAWVAATDCRVGLWDDLRGKCTKAALLVIDDLGRESSDWAAREWSDLIELRHNRGKKTIVTSNFTQDQFTARYGERVASRLSDARFSVIVKALGADLRKRSSRDH